ncbi:MAG TPA: polysaccharide deacetylase family protein [Pyrinomonadaceae bacterium]
MNSILVYHTISSPAQPLPGDIDISPERFEQQLQWLSRWRKVVRLNHTLRTEPGSRQVAITFDDGFRDNLTVALPLLEKYNLPMTLFVTAGFVNTPNYLSRAEVHEISKHPLITIGAHGLLHRHFTKLSRTEAKFELVESRRLLEEMTGTKIDLMAWPYGECNDELEEMSDEAGYRASWSVWKGHNRRHSLWRVPLGRNDNLPRFIAKVSGAYFPVKTLENKIAALRSKVQRTPVRQNVSAGA